MSKTNLLIVLIVIGGLFYVSGSNTSSNFSLGSFSPESLNADNCPVNIENDIEENAFSHIAEFQYNELDTERASFQLDNTNMENWSMKDNGYYKCSKGSQEGQNTNYYYCTPEVGNSAEYKKQVTDENGEILRTELVEIDVFAVNNQSNVVDSQCSTK